MITISVVCPRCGRQIQRTVDEDCAPSSLKCSCGSKLPLRMQKPSYSAAALDRALSQSQATEEAGHAEGLYHNLASQAS